MEMPFEIMDVIFLMFAAGTFWRILFWLKNKINVGLQSILENGWKANVVQVSIAIGALVWLTPAMANHLFFEMGLLKIPYLIPILIGFLIVWPVWDDFVKVFSELLFFLGKYVAKVKKEEQGPIDSTETQSEDQCPAQGSVDKLASDLPPVDAKKGKIKRLTIKGRRALVIVFFGFIVVIVGFVVVATGTNYFTYQMYAKFEPIPSIISTDPDTIRYTAQQVAYTEIENSIKAATEKAHLEHVRPFITSDLFAYIAPITPDGLLTVWTGKNPGYVVYNDHRDHKDTIKTNRVDQVQEIGLGMQWFDDLELVLYRTDWFATYDQPHFLVLDDKQPEKYTAVVPKVKYAWWRFPYWAGVVLIHDDGKVEDLDRAKALADPRLAGKWIAPMALMRRYVELQNYAVGYVQSFFRVSGKLEIPKIPGNNQFPLLTRSLNGHNYFVVPTKGEGGGDGLFRMYFGDSHTFQLTYFEVYSNNMIYGPNAALNRVQNLPGYNWHRKTDKNESGNMIATEPVYITSKDGKQMFWKFSITNKQYAGTSAVAVVNAHNVDQVLEFKQRPEFEEWLRGDMLINQSISTVDMATKIRWHLEQIRLLTETIQPEH
ncbi:hypothetical protein ISS03_04355 [Patescibacteria group bacterium]|nr:hypothetical protein [Patescibacteria group bacterium]